MHMAEGGDAQGGRGDARASCASPLGTPLQGGVTTISYHAYLVYKYCTYVHYVSKYCRLTYNLCTSPVFSYFQIKLAVNEKLIHALTHLTTILLKF